jgi:hypothetical protein
MMVRADVERYGKRAKKLTCTPIIPEFKNFGMTLEARDPGRENPTALSYLLKT